MASAAQVRTLQYVTRAWLVLFRLAGPPPWQPSAPELLERARHERGRAPCGAGGQLASAPLELCASAFRSAIDHEESWLCPAGSFLRPPKCAPWRCQGKSSRRGTRPEWLQSQASDLAPRVPPAAACPTRRACWMTQVSAAVKAPFAPAPSPTAMSGCFPARPACPGAGKAAHCLVREVLGVAAALLAVSGCILPSRSRGRRLAAVLGLLSPCASGPPRWACRGRVNVAYARRGEGRHGTRPH